MFFNWWRNRRARAKLKKQAELMTLPVIDNIKEGQRVGVLVSAQGTVMVYKYNYKIQRLRNDGDTLVLKRLKEVM